MLRQFSFEISESGRSDVDEGSPSERPFYPLYNIDIVEYANCHMDDKSIQIRCNINDLENISKTISNFIGYLKSREYFRIDWRNDDKIDTEPFRMPFRPPMTDELPKKKLSKKTLDDFDDEEDDDADYSLLVGRMPKVDPHKCPKCGSKKYIDASQSYDCQSCGHSW